MVAILWVMLIGGLVLIAFGWYMRRLANRDLSEYPILAIATNANQRKRTGALLIIFGIILIALQCGLENVRESSGV